MNRRINAIIIDDEPSARRLLHSMLEPHSGWITIVAEASNGREAIDLINERKPELVFLDIQMPDFTGFEVLEKISHHPDVIFTTAYEQYALKAFETFSVDYLLKPIREEHLENALQKLRSFGKKGSLNDFSQLQKLFESISTAKTPTAFPVRQGDKIILVRFETISHFEADDKYVSLFMTDGKKYLTDQTLTALSQKLPPEFLRVQKSFIINKERIREIRKHFNGRFVFIMDDIKQTRITTGLTFYETIKSNCAFNSVFPLVCFIPVGIARLTQFSTHIPQFAAFTLTCPDSDFSFDLVSDRSSTQFSVGHLSPVSL